MAAWKVVKNRLLDRFDSQKRGLVCVGQHVEEPVGPLSHVADALPEIGEQPLTPLLLSVLVEDDTFECPVFRITPVLSDPTNRFPVQFGKRSPS